MRCLIVAVLALGSFYCGCAAPPAPKDEAPRQKEAVAGERDPRLPTKAYDGPIGAKDK